MNAKAYIYSNDNLYSGNIVLPENVIKHIDDSHHVASKNKISTSMYSYLFELLGGEITYSVKNKPMHDSNEISVSHSNKFHGFAISDKSVGFDIEELIVEDKVNQLANMILTKKEKEEFAISKDKQTYLTIRWCVKEAYGKLIGYGLTKEAFDCDDIPYKWLKINNTIIVVVFKNINQDVEFFLNGEPLSGEY